MASCSWVPFLCAVIFCCKALLKRRDQRVLELWLPGKSQSQCSCVVSPCLVSPAKRIQHVAHLCVHFGRVGGESHSLSCLLECLGQSLAGDEHICLLCMRQRGGEGNLKASFVHKDTRIDCIGSLQGLELLIRIKWRRAEFESREIDCADEHGTIDRRSSVGERAQPD